MEANPEKEIMLDPRYAILEDGLGYNVLSQGGVAKTTQEGKEVIEFTIKPDAVVRRRYNLRFGNGLEIDEQGNMKLIVAKDDLIPLNLYDDANRKWLYTKSLKHDHTELSKRERTLQARITEMRNRLNLLEAQNIRLNEQLALARTNPQKFAKQGMELFESSVKTMSQLVKKDKKDDE